VGPPTLVPSHVAPSHHEQVTSGPEPRWGLGDVVLGIPFILAAVALVVAGIGLFGVFVDDSASLGPAETGGLALVVGLVVQQAATLAWPIIVSRWKGFGVRLDFGAFGLGMDVLYGMAAGVVLVALSAAVALAMAALVGLDDLAESSNTGFLDDVSGVAQLVLIAAVVIGAPLSEELFFRGLVLRAFAKRWNVVVGWLCSTLLFTAVHYSGGSPAAAVVLLASIGTLGLGLGALAMVTGRLGPSVVCHVTVNAIGVTAALTQGA
jgi:uncharacterized protein